MARKKKESVDLKNEPIFGLGDENKLIVQKSLPLFSLWKSKLTLSEFKILDVYLSRIDSHNPDRRTVIFEKGELEQILGVKRIREEELSERLLHLGMPIKVDDATVKNRKFAIVHLFAKSVAEQDENGTWKVELKADEEAMKYFFNVEDIGYLRYKLRCITQLNSRHTYIMFIYIEHNRRFRKRWEVPLDELKQMLGCSTKEYANEFKYFNRDVLKKIQNEMHKKTECRYSYTPIKKGYTVVAIRFEVETLPMLEIEIPEVPALEDPSRPIWESALEEWKLSREQLDELAALVAMVPAHKLPQIEDIEKARYQYIAQKAAEIKRRNEEKRIRSRFSYLRKLLQEDISSKPPQETQKPGQAASSGTQAFKNFTERKNNDYTKKILEMYSKESI